MMTNACRLVRILGIAAVAVAASATRAGAFTLELPAGLACSGFDLGIDIVGSEHRVSRTFQDENGNDVRVLNAGKGNALTFTNLTTGATLSLRPSGSVEHVTIEADGSQTWTTTGHELLILFPTDLPAGPSTTLYIGRLVFTVDASGVFTVQSFAGTSKDICAALE